MYEWLRKGAGALRWQKTRNVNCGQRRNPWKIFWSSFSKIFEKNHERLSKVILRDFFEEIQRWITEWVSDEISEKKTIERFLKECTKKKMRKSIEDLQEKYLVKFLGKFMEIFQTNSSRNFRKISRKKIQHVEMHTRNIFCGFSMENLHKSIENLLMDSLEKILEEYHEQNRRIYFDLSRFNRP